MLSSKNMGNAMSPNKYLEGSMKVVSISLNFPNIPKVNDYEKDSSIRT